MKKIILLLSIFSISLFGENISLTLPDLTEPKKLVGTLEMVLLFTILTLAPSFIFIMTAFTRLIIVFSIIKQALGLQNTPPAQLLTGLALILTFFIMKPTVMESYEQGVQPYMEEKIDYKEALEKSILPFKVFMLKNTRDKDLELFMDMRGEKHPEKINVNEIDFFTLTPAFVISELTTAFSIGILIFIPFLIIDIVVSSVLMSLGFMMLPPTMIALPIKLLFFVLIDGWYLLTKNLAESFM